MQMELNRAQKNYILNAIKTLGSAEDIDAVSNKISEEFSIHNIGIRAKRLLHMDTKSKRDAAIEYYIAFNEINLIKKGYLKNQIGRDIIYKIKYKNLLEV